MSNCNPAKLPCTAQCGEHCMQRPKFGTAEFKVDLIRRLEDALKDVEKEKKDA